MNKLFELSIFGLMANMLVFLFVLIFTQEPPPLWLVYPVPFFLTGLFIAIALESHR